MRGMYWVVTTKGRGGIEIEGGELAEGLALESDSLFCDFWAAVCEVTARSESAGGEGPVAVVSRELAASSTFSFDLSPPSARMTPFSSTMSLSFLLLGLPGAAVSCELDNEELSTRPAACFSSWSGTALMPKHAKRVLQNRARLPDRSLTVTLPSFCVSSVLLFLLAGVLTAPGACWAFLRFQRRALPARPTWCRGPFLSLSGFLPSILGLMMDFLLFFFPCG
jgi:hypothetical protein